jgi:hypothetical protein
MKKSQSANVHNAAYAPASCRISNLICLSEELLLSFDTKLGTKIKKAYWKHQIVPFLLEEKLLVVVIIVARLGL